MYWINIMRYLKKYSTRSNKRQKTKAESLSLSLWQLYSPLQPMKNSKLKIVMVWLMKNLLIFQQESVNPIVTSSMAILRNIMLNLDRILTQVMSFMPITEILPIGYAKKKSISSWSWICSWQVLTQRLWIPCMWIKTSNIMVWFKHFHAQIASWMQTSHLATLSAFAIWNKLQIKP